MNYEAFEVGPGTTQSAFNGSSVDHHCRITILNGFEHGHRVIYGLFRTGYRLARSIGKLQF
jgi:hypothetical protein